MPKIIKIGKRFTELFKNNTGTLVWDSVYITIQWNRFLF